MKELHALNLNLFDGAATAAGGEGSGSTGEVANSTSGTVVYGKQAEPAIEDTTGQVAADEIQAGPKTTSDILEAHKASFEELIKGEYKDEYDQRMQKALQRRFKEQKELSEYKQQSSDVLDLLYGKYGVNPGDFKALTEAVQSDESFFQEAADSEGMTVQQYKARLQLERENHALREAQQKAEAARQTEHIYSDWMRQTAELQKIYPAFDFESETANPQFTKLLESGVDVKAAYQAIHADEILQTGMTQTAQAVRKNVADNIKARGMRPAENGMSSQAGVLVKNDVSKLDAKDRAEIARRVRMGEQISF